MSHSATTLTDIIKNSFDGKKINLADATNLAPRAITKLTSTQAFTPSTLAKICSALLPDDARKLCKAVCLDLIPEEHHSELSLTKENTSLKEVNSPNGYTTATYPLDPRSEQILTRLRSMCAKEPDTKAWLHKIGDWIIEPVAKKENNESTSSTKIQPLRVAEDEIPYTTKRKIIDPAQDALDEQNDNGGEANTSPA